MSAITAKASRKMKKYAVLTREPRCFLGSFDFSWEQRKLGDIADIVGGGTPSTGNQSYWDGDIDWYAPAEIADQIYANSSQKKITGLGYENSSAKMLPPGTVLFTSRAGIGKTAILTRKGCTNQGFQSIVPHRGELDSYFIFSRTEELKRYGELVGAGSTFVEVSGKQMAVMELMMPPTMREQQTIGGFFQQLDNLITLHQRKCVFLFGLFQASISMIFTASTFSWEQRKLGDIGETYTGLSGKTKADFGHGQARFVTYMNVFSNPISNPEMTEPIEIDPKQNEVEVGDVLFTTSSETPEEVGMSSVLLEKRGKTYLNSFCFGFRPSEKIDSYYLAYMLRSESAREKIILLAQGISRYNISKNKVMEIAVSLPSLDEQKLIGQYFRQLDHLITLHQRECISFTVRAGGLILTANKKRTTSSWEQRKAIDIADYSKGNGYSKGDLADAGTPIILYGRLYTKYQFAISEVDTFAVPRNGAVYSQGNEVIVPASGETAEDIARASAVEKSGVLLGGDLNILRPFDFMNPLFLALAISNGEPQKELAKKAQGKSVVHIHNTDIQEVTIAYPSKTEQDRIVSVFRQLDNLITLHQRELEKLQNIKKSMLEKMFV